MHVPDPPSRLLFALLAVVAGCRGPADPAGGLAIALAVSAPVVRAGAPVTLTTTITNRDARPRTVETNTCGRPLLVTTAAGAPADSGERLCSLYSAPREIAPGGTYVVEGPWSAAVYTGGGAPTPLAAGVYRLRARIGVGVGGTDGEIRSEPVAVRVEDE